MIKHITKSQALLNLCPTEECIQLLRALSDETRQKIIALFYTNKELCVSDIAENFDLSRPTISHHLNLMKRVKLLNARKEKKEIYYSFNRAHVTKLMESILDSLKRCC
jgi:DNA-binding transcriptional ArsR family regulator